jgi:hypothetical protein
LDLDHGPSAAGITGRAHQQRDIFPHSNLFVRGAFEQNPQERMDVWYSHTRENNAGGRYFHGDPSTLCKNISSPKRARVSLSLSLGDPSKAAFCRERTLCANFMHALTKPLNSSTQKNFRPFRLLAPACSLAPAAVAAAPHKH